LNRPWIERPGYHHEGYAKAVDRPSKIGGVGRGNIRKLTAKGAKYREEFLK